VNPSETPLTPPPPRFVEHPARRRAWQAGQRNLAWGTAFFFAAVSVLGIALFIGGARAALPAVFCMLAFMVLWVLARMKVFGQRNGVFFALSVMALIGATVGLVEQAWRNFGGHSSDDSRGPSVALHDPDGILSPVTSPPEPQVMMEALKLETPEPTLPRVRAVRDLVTTVGGRSYRIRKGDTFLLADEKPGKFIIAANELLAQVPSDAMEQLNPQVVRAGRGPNAASQSEKGALDKNLTVQLEQRSQAEAVRRFPALGKAGTEEHRAFLETYNDLKQRKSEMLDDPEWPLMLAESLARRLGWEEAAVEDEPTSDTPPVVEPSIAPGTKLLAEPDAPAFPPAAQPADKSGDREPGIPLPPRTPR
jgi:hypothetical protein